MNDKKRYIVIAAAVLVVMLILFFVILPKDDSSDQLQVVTTESSDQLQVVTTESSNQLQVATAEETDDHEEAADNNDQFQEQTSSEFQDNTSQGLQNESSEQKDETTAQEQAETVDSEDPEEPEYEFRSNKLLNSHYDKHGREMGFDSPESYEDAASDVVNNPEALHKTEKEDGDDIYYVEKTNEFVVVSTDGYIRTYFNPSDGIKYYNRQ